MIPWDQMRPQVDARWEETMAWRMEQCGWVAIMISALACACSSGEPGESEHAAEVIGGGADPNPVIKFTQVTHAAGIDRSNEPASAGAFDGSLTYAYNALLADLDGDGLLDYYAVNHGQTDHVSGL